MIVLPISILLCITALIWIFRKSHIRIQWFLGLFGVGSAWITTFFLSSKVPYALEVAIWKPEKIFPTTLFISMDELSWPLIMAIISLFFLYFLTRPSRDEIFNSKENIGLLIYTCTVLLSLMAKNVITIVSIWIFMDGVILSMFIQSEEETSSKLQVFNWISKNTLSSFVLILAFILNFSKLGVSPFGSGNISKPVFILTILSSLLRMPFLSFSRKPGLIGWVDRGSTNLLDLYSAITGVALMALLFSFGIPEPYITSTRVLGSILLTIGVIFLAYLSNKSVFPIGIVLGLVGIGMLAETYSNLPPGILLTASGVLAIFATSTINLIRIYEKWTLFFPICIAFMLIGLPGSPGMLLTRTIRETFLPEKSLIHGLLISMGVLIYSIVILRTNLMRKYERPSTENLTRFSYFAGVIIFPVSGIVIGLTLSSDITISDFFSFFIMMIVGGGIYLGTRSARFEIPEFRPIQKFRVFSRYLFTIRIPVAEIIRGSGNIFESQTGMLWTFVILLMAVLAFVDLGI